MSKHILQHQISAMRIRDRTVVYLYSISVCMGSIVFGYSLTSYEHVSGLITQANSIDSESSFHNVTTLINHLLPLAAIFGVSFYNITIGTFDFLNTFIIIDLITILISVIGAISFNLTIQILYRFVLGLMVGLSTVSIPTYLTSCLPGSMGGPAGSLNQFFIVFGIFLGYVFGLFFYESELDDFGWRFLIAFPILPSLIRIYTTKYVFPFQSVEGMIQNNDDEMLQQYIDCIWEDVTLEEFKQSKKLDEEDIIAEQVSIFDEASQSFRARFKIVCVILFLNQFSGNGTTFALGHYVFPQVLGFQTSDIIWGFIKLSFLQVAVTYFSGQFLQKYGRRAFLFEGMRIIIVANILIALLQYAAPELKYVEYLLIFLHMVGFSLSFGPCSLMIGTETLYNVTYPAMIFWCSTFILGVIRDQLFMIIGVAGVFLMFAVLALLGLLYLGAFMVETQGKSRKQLFREYRKAGFPLTLKWRKFLTKRGTAPIANESQTHLKTSYQPQS